MFTIPQGDGRVLVGLTDVPVTGPVPDVPVADEHDEHFLLTTISSALDAPLGPQDVIGRFAGLRPLLEVEGSATADLSRRHALIESDDGVLTLVGGKLTTYRRMAEDALDRIAQRPGVSVGRSRTAHLPLLGAAPRERLDRIDAPPHLVRRYGTEALTVLAMARHDPALAGPVAPGVPTIGAELAYGIAHEGALTVEDLLDRRTRVGLVPGDREAALPVALALTAALGRPSGDVRTR